MDLITAEIKALNNRCEQLEVNKESLNNEINLLNKLLFCEQKYTKHLNDLFVFYEKNFVSNNKYLFAKEINDNKVIAKQNELELKKLRKELIDWKKENKRNEGLNIDHTYSSINNNQNKTQNENSIANNSKSTNSLLKKSTTEKSQTIISSNSFTISESINTDKQKDISNAIHLEIIPKCEPLSDIETDSAPETEDVMTNANKRKEKKSNNGREVPFLLVSEYLSKTKNFSHLLNKNDEKSDENVVNSSAEENADKSIAIDLNRDSDQDSAQERVDNELLNVFTDEIIDLTPKTPNKKLKARSKLKSRAKSRKLKRSLIQAKRGNIIKKKVIKPKPQKNKAIITSKCVKKSIKPIVERNKAPNIVFSVEDNSYYCKWKSCEYKSLIKRNTVRHYRTHTGEKNYECSVCSKRFSEKRTLNNHVMVHKRGEKFAQRSKIISNLSQKVVNKNRIKKQNMRGEGNMLCPIPNCDRKYYELSHLMRHLNQTHGPKKAEKFKKEYYKQKYILCNNIVISKPVVKSPNKAVFKKSINQSPKRVVNKSEKVVNQSPKSALRKRCLIDDNEKQWKCDYNKCERKYVDKHNLKRHQLEIHRKLSKVFFKDLKSKNEYKFFIPPKVFDNNNIIDKNKSINSKETQKYVCEMIGCNNVFYSYSGLYKHLKTKHLLAKNEIHINKIVEKTEQTEQLPEIIESNIKNKPSLTREWVCEIPNCNSRYIYKQNLKRHHKEHHSLADDQQSIDSNTSLSSSKEKFECTYNLCGFFTFHKRSLIVHYKTHFESNDKPFKCLITDCNYSVDALHKLKNHVLNKHSEQQFFRAMEETGVHYPVW